MAKTLLSMQDLQARALAEIRKQPGCSNVRNIAINHVTDERAENNWSLCVLSAGAADANTAAQERFLLNGDASPYRQSSDCLGPAFVPARSDRVRRRQLLRGRLIASDLSFSDRADFCRCCWLRGPF